VALSTSRDLLKRIEAVEFHANLNSRLAGIQVSITPLRERTSGIPTLAEALLQRI
jgi:DNA-binding NtrC family response regulator